MADIERFVADQGVEMMSFGKPQRKDEVTQQVRDNGRNGNRNCDDEMSTPSGTTDLRQKWTSVSTREKNDCEAGAVSYTHLDVYKRQAFRCTSLYTNVCACMRRARPGPGRSIPSTGSAK